MKRVSMVLAVILAMAALTAASGAGQPAPQQKEGITLPGAQPQAQPQPPQQARPPQAKTPEEYQTFVAVLNNPDLAAADIQAREFVAKFPQSELKGVIYEALMTKAQEANNADRLIDFGRRSLEFSPDRAPVLILVAFVLADRTRETDLDKDEKLAEAIKYAQRGLENVDATAIPAGMPAEEAAGAKTQLRAMAHSAIGTSELVKNNFAAAEKHLKEGIQLQGNRPDALSLFRLALAQDKQGKYAEALTAASRAVELANPQDPATTSMINERDRLKKLAGGPPPAGTAPANQPPQKPQ